MSPKFPKSEQASGQERPQQNETLSPIVQGSRAQPSSDSLTNSQYLQGMMHPYIQHFPGRYGQHTRVRGGYGRGVDIMRPGHNFALTARWDYEANFSHKIRKSGHKNSFCNGDNDKEKIRLRNIVEDLKHTNAKLLEALEMFKKFVFKRKSSSRKSSKPKSPKPPPPKENANGAAKEETTPPSAPPSASSPSSSASPILTHATKKRKQHISHVCTTLNHTIRAKDHILWSSKQRERFNRNLKVVFERADNDFKSGQINNTRVKMGMDVCKMCFGCETGRTCCYMCEMYIFAIECMKRGWENVTKRKHPFNFIKHKKQPKETNQPGKTSPPKEHNE